LGPLTQSHRAKMSSNRVTQNTQECWRLPWRMCLIRNGWEPTYLRQSKVKLPEHLGRVCAIPPGPWPGSLPRLSKLKNLKRQSRRRRNPRSDRVDGKMTTVCLLRVRGANSGSRSKRVANKPGAWQGQCPYHKLSQVSGCKMLISAAGPRPEDISLALMMIKQWCLCALDFDRQRTPHSV
jgi:hypothetical protein